MQTAANVRNPPSLPDAAKDRALAANDRKVCTVCEFIHGAEKGRFLKRRFVKHLQNRRNAYEMPIVSRITFKTAQTVEHMISKFA